MLTSPAYPDERKKGPKSAVFKLLFANRWFALIWVGLMLGSVAVFAGKDGAAEKLGQTVQKIADQQRELAVSEPPVIEPEVDEPIAPPTIDATQPEPEGEIFINPETGQKIRIVRRSLPEGYAPDTIN
jgi:hypothetical protein